MNRSKFARRGRRWKHKRRWGQATRYLYVGGKFAGAYQVDLVKYVCGECGAVRVKLWRDIGSAADLWCGRCACAYVGRDYAELDADGKITDSWGRSRTDQIYSQETGRNLLPAVPDARPNRLHEVPDSFWGYTSVPMEDVAWWKALPLEQS